MHTRDPDRLPHATLDGPGPGRDAFKTMDEGPVRTDATKPSTAILPPAATPVERWARGEGPPPKTQAEIDAEKRAKPRPDLLPARALAFALERFPLIAGAFAALAAYQRTREIEAIGGALELVIEQCIEDKHAATSADVLMLAGEIMGVGLRKHGPCTWRVAGTEQADPQTHYAGAVRHMLERCAGKSVDPDSGRPPLLHAVCQLSILINLLDDPPSTEGENDGRAMIR